MSRAEDEATLAALALYDQHGMSFEEIGRHLGLDPAWVKFACVRVFEEEKAEGPVH